MPEYESYELTEFNLDKGCHIPLPLELGLLKIMRSDDGHLLLICDGSYRLIDQDKPTHANIGDIDAMLGFVLDIGIRKEKKLTYGSGFYFGTKLTQSQSAKKISNADFDIEFYRKIEKAINGQFKSGNKEKETKAIRLNHLLTAYNNARLLFPNFYNDSFLGLMRVLDATSNAKGACDFAVSVSSISSELNEEIYTKVNSIEGYHDRINIAEELFNDCLENAKKQKWECATYMAGLTKSGKFVFACFYSAYQYRNKFVHQGLPFPDTVKEAWGLENESGTAYLNPSLGTSLVKVFRPTGFETGDDIDIHAVMSDLDEIKDFKEKYYLLLPSWHYVRRIARQALVEEIDKMDK